MNEIQTFIEKNLERGTGGLMVVTGGPATGKTKMAYAAIDALPDKPVTYHHAGSGAKLATLADSTVLVLDNISSLNIEKRELIDVCEDAVRMGHIVVAISQIPPEAFFDGEVLKDAEVLRLDCRVCWNSRRREKTWDEQAPGKYPGT